MLSGAERALIDQLYRRCTRLDDPEITTNIYQGLITSADRIYHLEHIGPGRYLSRASGTTRAPSEVAIEDELMKPLVSGEEAKRYIEPRTSTYILFPYRRVGERMELIAKATFERAYPNAWAYLRSHEAELRRREATLDEDGNFKRNDQGEPERAPFDDDNWYRFGRSQNLDKQDIQKLVVAQTVPSMRACYDENAIHYLNNVRVNGIIAGRRVDHWFLLGILNGAVCDFVFKRIAKPKDGSYFEANKQFIAPLPVPAGSAEEQAEVAVLARRLQTLHSSRRDALSELAYRIESSPRRSRRLSFLLPAILPPGEREDGAPEDADKTEWAKAQYEIELQAAYEELGRAVNPDVQLEASFERGELTLSAEGAPLLRGIFLSDEEGPFVVAQWNAIIRTFPINSRTTGKKLADALRRLIVSDNAALREQVIRLQANVTRLDDEIVAAEATINQLLYRLYELSPDEIQLVEAG